MIKKLFFIVLLALSIGLTTTYAQSTALDIAQNQARSSTTFANEQLTASNANRYAALQNQVGSTISSHGSIVDDSKRNLDQVLIKLNLATSNYTSFNLRFLH